MNDNQHLNATSRNVLECFGMPGVGKTYLSSRLGSMLKSDGLIVGDKIMAIHQMPSVKRMAKKIRLIIASLWTNRNANIAIWKLIRLHRPHNIRAYVKLLINWLFVYALIRAESRNSDIVLLDQGILQALWSTKYYGYGRSEPDNQVVAKLVSYLLKELNIAPLSIIYVSADDELIKKRIFFRENGNSPLDRDIHEFVRAKTVTEQSMAIIELLAERKSTIIITHFDNTDTGNNTVDDLKLALPMAFSSSNPCRRQRY